MAAPSVAITRLDLSFSQAEFHLRMNRQGFVGLQVLPPVLVAKPSADFVVIPTKALLTPIEDTARAPKTGYRRSDFEWEKDSYATQEHGVEEVVDDATIEMYGDVLRTEQIHAERAINRLLQTLEHQAAQAVFNTSTWTGSALTTAVSTPWSNQGSATPIDNVDAAIEKVEDNCGHRANAILLTGRTLRKWSRTAQVKDQWKAVFGDDTPIPALAQVMRQLHEFEFVFVADGYKNSAKPGQEPTLTRFWDPSMVMVFHHSPNGDQLEDPLPSLGRTILFQEQVAALPGVDDAGEGAIIVEEYREEARRGGVIRARFNYQQKILRPEAGHLLTNVL
jgi:hypothetical protein